MTYICDDVLKGVPLTLHATPYGRPLYEELGFETTGRAEMLRGSFSPDAAAPARNTVRVRPAGAGDIPGSSGWTPRSSAPTGPIWSPGCPPSRTGCSSPRTPQGN